MACDIGHTLRHNKELRIFIPEAKGNAEEVVQERVT